MDKHLALLISFITVGGFIVGFVYLLNLFSMYGTIIGLIQYKFGWYRYKPLIYLRNHYMNNPDDFIVKYSHGISYAYVCVVKVNDIDVTYKLHQYTVYDRAYWRGDVTINSVNIPTKYEREMLNLFQVIVAEHLRRGSKGGKSAQDVEDEENQKTIESFFMNNNRGETE